MFFFCGSVPQPVIYVANFPSRQTHPSSLVVKIFMSFGYSLSNACRTKVDCIDAAVSSCDSIAEMSDHNESNNPQVGFEQSSMGKQRDMDKKKLDKY